MDEKTVHTMLTEYLEDLYNQQLKDIRAQVPVVTPIPVKVAHKVIGIKPTLKIVHNSLSPIATRNGDGMDVVETAADLIRGYDEAGKHNRGTQVVKKFLTNTRKGQPTPELLAFYGITTTTNPEISDILNKIYFEAPQFKRVEIEDGGLYIPTFDMGKVVRSSKMGFDSISFMPVSMSDFISVRGKMGQEADHYALQSVLSRLFTNLERYSQSMASVKAGKIMVSSAALKAIQESIFTDIAILFNLQNKEVKRPANFDIKSTQHPLHLSDEQVEDIEFDQAGDVDSEVVENSPLLNLSKVMVTANGDVLTTVNYNNPLLAGSTLEVKAEYADPNGQKVAGAEIVIPSTLGLGKQNPQLPKGRTR